MSIQVLPETDIPIHCFKCRRQLEPEEVTPNPFPTPVDNRQEWHAYSFRCVMCGTSGQFQYRFEEEVEE